MSTDPTSLTSPLSRLLARAIAQAGGWIGFDRFMALALYAPGLGYYANDSRKFGTMPGGVQGGGSDFVTAPELSPLFGRALAEQVGQALSATGTREIWEFGAGSGALALQLLDALGDRVDRYTVVELSAVLRERQQTLLAAHADKLCWVSELPATLHGVVVGNEVLDAMPVKLLARTGGEWHERGVVWHDDRPLFADVSTALRPPRDIPGPHDYLTEIHLQAEAFMRTLADRLKTGAAFLVDYGFAESEYYHPQRHMGTLMCHQGHRADGDPLSDLGRKDITAHVNFTGVALAAQEAGLPVLGYTTQARFLMNCGLPAFMETASTAQRARAFKLVAEHEMGELFKVIALSPQADFEPLGFAQGDRSHTL